MKIAVHTILLALTAAAFTWTGALAFDALNRPVEPIICKSKVHCHRVAAGLPAAYAVR